MTKPTSLEARSAKDLFSQEYAKNVTYAPLISGVGTTSFRHTKLDRIGDETLDDLCMHVTLRSVPPKEYTFPLSYNGLRIYYSYGNDAIPMPLDKEQV